MHLARIMRYEAKINAHSAAKTQASLPDEDAMLLLLCGLLRSGQIRIDGRNDIPKPKAQLKAESPVRRCAPQSGLR
jgi:hypothetical protein